MRDYVRVEVASRAALRAWLQAHHGQSESIWLVTPKKSAGAGYIPYDAIVEEALCFGWIDSLPRRLDAMRSMLLLSPRRRNSAWSRPNRDRVERLIASGQMQPAGMAKIEAAKADGSWDRLKPVEAEQIPPTLETALAGNGAARSAFAALTPARRRLAIRWIVDARSEPTRARRIAALLVALEQGLAPGDWRVGLAG